MTHDDASPDLESITGHDILYGELANIDVGHYTVVMPSHRYDPIAIIGFDGLTIDPLHKVYVSIRDGSRVHEYAVTAIEMVRAAQSAEVLRISVEDLDDRDDTTKPTKSEMALRRATDILLGSYYPFKATELTAKEKKDPWVNAELEGVHASDQDISETLESIEYGRIDILKGIGASLGLHFNLWACYETERISRPEEWRLFGPPINGTPWPDKEPMPLAVQRQLAMASLSTLGIGEIEVSDLKEFRSGISNDKSMRSREDEQAIRLLETIDRLAIDERATGAIVPRRSIALALAMTINDDLEGACKAIQTLVEKRQIKNRTKGLSRELGAHRGNGHVD